MKISLLLLAILSTGCILEPKKRVRVIDCGTLNLTDPNGERRDTVAVIDGVCVH